jgi:hypothetical protein
MRYIKSAFFLYAIAIAAVALIGASLMQPNAKADANINITVNVSIQAVGQVSISPGTVSFININPSAQSSDVTMDIKNTGSINVSQIHVFVDTLSSEPTRPYGRSNASFYSAGGVVVIHNSTESASNYWYAGRLEWNSTSDVSNKVVSSLTSPASWGFFRNTSREFFWAVGNGSSPAVNGAAGQCNNTGAQFAIDPDLDNGTAASRTADTTGVSAVQTGTDWGLFSINSAGNPLNGYCVAVYYNCSKIYIYKYDKRTDPNFGNCANSNYLQEPNLVPGDYQRMTLNIFTPGGIPSGVMNVTRLTVLATST